jgi:DNA-binding transcriptional LysR family regulator
LRILREVEDAELLVLGLSDVPRGLLRVSAPVYFGELYVAPLLAGLLREQPELKLELSLSDRFVDLVAEGFDLAVRIGPVSSTSLMARKLARTRVVACAAPSYLERRGSPAVPKDLLDHDCLRYSLDPLRHSWRFKSKAGSPISIPVTGGFECNHGGALRQAAIAGLGIALLPLFYAIDAVQRGELLTVLDEYCAAEIDIQAVYPTGKLLPPKTRVCVDWLAQNLPERLVPARSGTRQPGRGAAR